MGYSIPRTTVQPARGPKVLSLRWDKIAKKSQETILHLSCSWQNDFYDQRNVRAGNSSTLIYIQSHLESHLTLELLAGRAGFSPYHFHRIFRDAIGEPAKAYIRRLRMDRGVYRP